MITPRRPLGTGPRPEPATAQARTERGRTAAERAADEQPAPCVEELQTQLSSRRRLGAGPQPESGGRA